MTDGVSPLRPAPSRPQGWWFSHSSESSAGLSGITTLDGVTFSARSWTGSIPRGDGLARSRPSTFRDVHMALTFDDATEDHFDVALELDRRGMKGVFFTPAG